MNARHLSFTILFALLPACASGPDGRSIGNDPKLGEEASTLAANDASECPASPQPDCSAKGACGPQLGMSL